MPLPLPSYQHNCRRRYANASTHQMAPCHYKKQSLKPPNSCPLSRIPHYHPHSSKYRRAPVCPFLPCQLSIYVPFLPSPSHNTSSQTTVLPIIQPPIEPTTSSLHLPPIKPVTTTPTKTALNSALIPTNSPNHNASSQSAIPANYHSSNQPAIYPHI